MQSTFTAVPKSTTQLWLHFKSTKDILTNEIPNFVHFHWISILFYRFVWIAYFQSISPVIMNPLMSKCPTTSIQSCIENRWTVWNEICSIENDLPNQRWMSAACHCFVQCTILDVWTSFIRCTPKTKLDSTMNKLIGMSSFEYFVL